MNGLGATSRFSCPATGLEKLRGRLKERAEETIDTSGDQRFADYLTSGSKLIEVLLDTEYEDTLDLIELKYINRYE